MFLRKFLLFSILAVLVAACTGKKDEQKDVSLYVSAFLKDNAEAVFYGHSDISKILNKSDYKNHDLLQAVLDFNIGALENSIDLTKPVYFIGEGPLKQDGAPKSLHLFLQVKDKDSLVARLGDTWSYDVNESKDFVYTEDGDFALGIKNDLAIITITGEEYNAETLMKENFARAEGEVSGGKDDEILKEKADLMFAVKLENLYGTSNTDLEELNKQTRDEIKEMAKESYIVTTFRFDNGAATVESRNMFNQKLKDELFFRSDNSSTIYDKLNKGDGTMLGAFSANIDLDKLEDFTKKYSPETLNSIHKVFGIESVGILGLFGSEKMLSKLGDGRLGMAFYGDQMENSFNVNAFWGATNTGQQLFKFVKHNIPMELEYEYGDDGVYGSGSLTYGGGGSENRIPLPKGCEGFGKKGITAFVNFHDIDMEMFEYEGAWRLIEIVDYATFEYDENGGRLYIKAKNGKENILKQGLDIMIGELSDMIGRIAV